MSCDLCNTETLYLTRSCSKSICCSAKQEDNYINCINETCDGKYHHSCAYKYILKNLGNINPYLCPKECGTNIKIPSDLINNYQDIKKVKYIFFILMYFIGALIFDIYWNIYTSKNMMLLYYIYIGSELFIIYKSPSIYIWSKELTFYILFSYILKLINIIIIIIYHDSIHDNNILLINCVVTFSLITILLILLCIFIIYSLIYSIYNTCHIYCHKNTVNNNNDNNNNEILSI